MRYFIGIFLAVLCLPLCAEDRSDFGGTWINARFSEALKQTRSLANAREAVESNTPIWVAIDTERRGQSTLVSFDGSSGNRWRLEQLDLDGIGRTWVLSDTTGPKWLVTVDVQSHLYLLLHKLHDQAAPPIVLTRSPSRVQDPAFHIGQVVTSVMLLGTYQSPDGVSYAFNQDMTASVGDRAMRFSIKIDAVSDNVFVMLSDIQGNVSPFLVNRKDDTLELTDRYGKKVLLAASN